jgi:2,6-dihydroxypyridine 3-monooxygenase
MVTVHFADGSHEELDLMVCADGVGSRFRNELMPTSHRSYSGYVGWRGMVPESELSYDVRKGLGDAITYYVYANSHILVYPIPALDGTVVPGQRLMNFVWYRNYLVGDDLTDLLTDTQGVVREISIPPGFVRERHIQELHATAHARLPKVIAAVVEAVREPFIQVIYDVEVSHMAFGRVCLIGDAAFVARPHAAAGTAKAAADAWALASALEEYPSIPLALQQREGPQLELGRQLLERTRALGYRSQVASCWDPTSPDVLFRLRGDS